MTNLSNNLIPRRGQRLGKWLIRSWKTLAGLTILAAGLGYFLIYPLGYAIWGAFSTRSTVNGNVVVTYTHAYIQNIFLNASLRESIVNSLLMGLVVTAGTLALTLPLSYIAARVTFRGRAILTGLILLPMIMPPFVGAIGMRTMLARFGTVNLFLQDLGLLAPGASIDWFGASQFLGVAILEILHLYPIMFLNVTASLANVDPTLEDAARNMGSGPWGVFRKVTFPLMLPGVFAGGVMVFIWAFTDLGTPLIFGYRPVVPVRIFSYVSEINQSSEGYALVVFVLVLTLLLFWLSKELFGKRAHAMMARAASQPREIRAGWVGTMIIWMVFGGLTALALLPHAGVVLSSVSERWFQTALPSDYTLDHFKTALGHEMTFSSIKNSLALSIIATGINLLAGSFIAWVLVRKRIPLAGLLDALVMLPLAIPGIVLAFGYMGETFHKVPLLDPAVSPMPLLAIAYAVRRLPYVVCSAVAGLQQTSVTLEEASVNLGAGPVKTFFKITMPLVYANLLAGGILAFAFAMLEVSDSLILAQNPNNFPITKAIYALFSRLGDGPYVAAALGVWAMAFLALSLMSANLLMGKKMGQIFRAS